MALVPTDDFYIGAVLMFCRMRAQHNSSKKEKSIYIYSTFIDQQNFTFLLSLSLSLTQYINKNSLKGMEMFLEMILIA